MDKDNFDEEIKEGVTFVSFLSPDSENWNRLAPTWEELAANNLEGVKIGTVNCRAEGAHGPNRKLCVKNGVKIFFNCNFLLVSPMKKHHISVLNNYLCLYKIGPLISNIEYLQRWKKNGKLLW